MKIGGTGEETEEEANKKGIEWERNEQVVDKKKGRGKRAEVEENEEIVRG